MYQILIADDHPDQVASLKQLLGAERFADSDIHEAYDGYEALEIVKSKPIHIAITDIRMPGMDGLELIRNIRLLSPRTRIIILSGYAQFEYAQRALEYRVTNYLLKPVEKNQLLACMASVVSTIAKREDDDRMIYAFKENRQFLIGRFLNELLTGKFTTADYADKKLRALEIAVPANQNVFVLAGRMEGRFLQYNQYDVSIMEFAIRNLFEEILGEDMGMLSCKDANDYLLFLVYSKHETVPDFGKIKQYALHLQDQVEQLLKGKITLVASSLPAVFPSGLGPRYAAVLSQMRRVSSAAEGGWETVGEEPGESAVGSVERLYQAPLLYRLFEMRQWGQARDKVEDIFNEMNRKQLSSFAHIQEVFYGITSAFAYVLHKNGIELTELADGTGGAPGHAPVFKTSEQLRIWIMDLFGLIQERLGHTSEHNGASLIDRIAGFVERNLSRDLSLQAIADHVGLHPVYLSRIFKLETGIGLSVYLLKVRMEHAARMLADTDLKIYEIAGRLGYLTPHYFIKLFKEHYGTTPQEYREKLFDSKP